MRAVTDGPGRRSRKLSRSAVKPSTRNTRPRSRNRCCVHCARRAGNCHVRKVLRQARGVVVDAVAGSGPVTPMELLTALLTSDRGIATEVLTESGVTLDVIRHAGAGSNEGSSNNFDDDAEILKSIGIDLDAVRESLEQSFGEGVLDETLCRTASTLLARADSGSLVHDSRRTPRRCWNSRSREALAHKDNRIAPNTSCSASCVSPTGLPVRPSKTQVTMSVIRERLEAKMNRAA